MTKSAATFDTSNGSANRLNYGICPPESDSQQALVRRGPESATLAFNAVMGLPDGRELRPVNGAIQYGVSAVIARNTTQDHLTDDR